MCSVRLVKHTGSGWRRGSWKTGSHFAETLLGIGPHLDSLKEKNKDKSLKIELEHVSVCNRVRRSKYLFTHADLHDSIADERFMQIFVFLLLEAFDVLPGCLNKLSVDAITHRKSTDDTGAKEYLQTLRQLPFAPNFTFPCYPVTS